MNLEQFLQQNSSTLSTAGGMLGAAANIGMGIYNMEQQKKMLREQMQFNRAESAKQRQFALEQWQRENAYNSPAAQMDRLRAAGINPALAYSNGSIDNTGGGTPSFSEAAAPGGLPQFHAQVDPLMVAQINSLNAQAEKARAEANTENTLRSAREREIWSLIDLRSSQEDHIAAQIGRWVKENELTDAQKSRIDLQNMLDSIRIDIDKQYLDNDIQRVNNDTERVRLQSELNEATIKNLNADTRKKLAEAKVTERELKELIWTYALRKSGLANKVNLDAATTASVRATEKKLGIEYDNLFAQGYVDRVLAEQSGNGSVGATIVLSAERLMSDIGRILGVSVSAK